MREGFAARCNACVGVRPPARRAQEGSRGQDVRRAARRRHGDVGSSSRARHGEREPRVRRAIRADKRLGVRGPHGQAPGRPLATSHSSTTEAARDASSCSPPSTRSSASWASSSRSHCTTSRRRTSRRSAPRPSASRRSTPTPRSSIPRPDPLVLYFFHPFGVPALKQVLSRVLGSLEREPRPAYVVLTGPPDFAKAVEESGFRRVDVDELGWMTRGVFVAPSNGRVA